MATPKYNAPTWAPADEAVAVVKSDATILTPTRGLYVGGAGDVTVDMETAGTDVVFAGVPAGTVLPIKVKKVKAATTATLIVALY